MDTTTIIKYCLLGLLALFILITIYSVHLALAKMRQLEASEKLREGMTEHDVLKIMGEGFIKEQVDDDAVYIWKGNVSKNYSGIKEVKVYVKNGLVSKIVKKRQ